MSTQRIRGGFEPYPILSGQTVHVAKRHLQSDLTTTTTHTPGLRPYVGNLMVDRVTPRFRELVAQGAIVNNYMSKSNVDVSDQYFTGLAQRYTWTGTLSTGATKEATWTMTNMASPLPPGLSVIPYDYSLEIQEIVNKAYNKAYQQDVMGLVDLAEIGKTADLLRESFALIELIVRRDLREYRNFRRSQRNRQTRDMYASQGKVLNYYGKTLAGKAADASNLFLAYTYGVLPLMSTIEGLLKQLDERLKPVRQTYRSSSHTERLYDATTPLYTDPWGEGQVQIGVRTDTVSASWDLRAGVLTDFQATLSDRLGLSAHNIPSAVYELIPFSFVVDWVWALGPALSALTPNPKFRTLASWSVITQSITRNTVTQRSHAFANHSSGNSHFEYFPYTTGCNIVEEYKTRTPGVTPGIPNVKINFSQLPHLLNGLALGFSSLRRTSLARL